MGMKVNFRFAIIEVNLQEWYIYVFFWGPLFLLGKLKRNTVAFERAVEYGGNIKQLSCDARFAIANMTVRMTCDACVPLSIYIYICFPFLTFADGVWWHRWCIPRR